MSKSTERKAPTALAAATLLAALVEYEQKHTRTDDLMSIEMFSDGSGHLETLKQGDIFEFLNLDELMEKLKAANHDSATR